MAIGRHLWAFRDDAVSIYNRNAGPTLMGLMSKAKAMGADRVSLNEEIDLARSLLIRATEMYSTALDDGKTPEELKLVIESHVRDGIDCVSDVVTKASKVRELNEAMMSGEVVSWIVAEVTQVIESKVRMVSDELADQVVAALQAIELPHGAGRMKVVKAAANEEFM